jgi:hypothetical protein
MLHVSVDREEGKIKFLAFDENDYEANLGEALLDFIYLNLDVTLFDDSYVLEKGQEEIKRYFTNPDSFPWFVDESMQTDRAMYNYHPYLYAGQKEARRITGTAFKKYYKNNPDYTKAVELQKRLLHAVSYIFDADNKAFKIMSTAAQRYYAYVRFIAEYDELPINKIDRGLSGEPELPLERIAQLPSVSLSCWTPQEDQTQSLDDISKQDIRFQEIYECNSIEEAYRVELYYMIVNNISIRKCGYCGRYFINNKYKNSLYCNRIPDGETKPCYVIAPRKNYEKKLKSNDIAGEYRKRYKTLFARIKNSPSPSEEKMRFDKWKDKAAPLRDEALRANMDIDKFKSKLKEIERSVRNGQH